MDIIRRIADYTSLIVTLGTLGTLLLSVVFYLSWPAKNRAGKLKAYITGLYKNLPERSVDDFDLTGDLKLRTTCIISDCVARTRVAHSSSASDDSGPAIEVFASGGILAIHYNFRSHNTDEWVSYVVQNFCPEIAEYFAKGYYLTFTAVSKDATRLTIETKSPELKTKIPIYAERTTYCYKLSEIVHNIHSFCELCFVLRPAMENRLSGAIEISEFKLCKKPLQAPLHGRQQVS